MGATQTQEEKFIHMTQEPVPHLICELAGPTIISMLVTSFYNMADTFFVGQVGTSATGAVGIAFSVMAVIQAFGFFFGHGSGNYVSRKLGAQEFDEAAKMAATGFVSAFMMGLVIMVAGLAFLDPLCHMLGATDTILPYARSYLGFILIGAPYMTASLVLNNQLRFQGSAFYAMIGIASGAVINIVLDPIFIFVFHMGIGGAALATIISQFISFCLLLIGCTRGGNLKIHISRVQLKWSYYSMIIRGGLPSLARQGLASVATICLNHAAGPYGDAAIAAMSVVQRITTFGASAMIGFGQGFQPVCGFNFGARLYRRVREGFFFCVKTATVFLLAMSILGFIFAPQLISLFRDDPEVIRYGTSALRFQCVTFCLQGWVVMSNMMLQTIGRTVPATFLAMARQGVFFVPLVWILSHTLGMLGVQLAQPVSDLCTILCAIPIQCRVLGEMARAPEAN